MPYVPRDLDKATCSTEEEEDRFLHLQGGYLFPRMRVLSRRDHGEGAKIRATGKGSRPAEKAR